MTFKRIVIGSNPPANVVKVRAANPMKLELAMQPDSQTARYMTADGLYQVFGDDIGTRCPAGVVWSWRPNAGHWEWTEDLRSFGSKASCLADLKTAYWKV